MIDRSPAPTVPFCQVSNDVPEAVEQLGFDVVIERLRSVVERLETGKLSLEDSLRAYEEGVALARRGHGLLDGAEKRVELLVNGRDGLHTVPLADGGDGNRDS